MTLLQAVAQWLEKALPFIAILLAVFIRKHIIGALAAFHNSHVPSTLRMSNHGFREGGGGCRKRDRVALGSPTYLWLSILL